MRSLRPGEAGFSAIWTAITAFFIMGVAAIAVDVSGFYREARFEQSAADMTCLAGVRELPQNVTAGLDAAVGVAKQNWPKLAPVAPDTTVPDTAVLDDGQGNSVSIVARYNGDPTKMAVTVSQRTPTKFGKVLGARSAQITQVAYCKTFGLKLGDLPFGSVPGGLFDGVLQEDNPCNTGNCRPLELPRTDIAGSGNWFVRNVAIGAELDLLANKTNVDLVTCAVGSGPCSIVDQDQGVSSGQLSDGLARGGAGVDGRLENPKTPNTFPSLAGRILDGDSPADVLDPDLANGASVEALSAVMPAPADIAWDPQVHGDMTAVMGGPDAAKHLYFDGVIHKCQSPRFARIPIIAQTTWLPGDPVALPGGNSDPVKVVGFYLVILTDPNEPTDFQNPSDALKTTSAVAVWLGGNASCTGTGGQVKPYEQGDAKVFRLVDENA